MPENRAFQLLLGPELLWVLFYAAISLTVRLTAPPSKEMDPFWINLAYLVPLVAVPLTFALYYLPGIERNWLLLRIWIACLVGGHYVLEKGLKAHSEQGPGVGTVYIMDIGLVLLVLVAGSIWAKVKF